VKASSGLLATALLLAAPAAFGKATIIIVNGDGPSTGFNDPTPVAPVGGNPGTTLGAQRLAVFQAVAEIWGQALDSAVPISVLAHFQPLTCDASGATLGSAGPTNIFSSDDPSLDGGVSPTVFPRARTWYVSAETQRFAGKQLLSGTGTDPANFVARHPADRQLRRAQVVLRAGRPPRECDRPLHRGAARVRPRARVPEPHRQRHR
jgi:hypothetical protein